MEKTIIISSENTWWKIDLKEIWDYRELLYILTWRDIKVRYKQTVLGVLWVIIQPIATTGIFTIFFGKIAKIPSDGLPYPLFAFAGLTIWNYFSNGLSAASNSITSNLGLIQKIYFPRIIIIFSAIVTSTVDFLINILLLGLALIYFHYTPSPMTIIIFPLVLIILFLFISATGMFAAALNIRYRDIRFLLPFAVQFGLYVTPIIYPLSVVTDYRRIFLIINPLTAVVETTRALILSNPIDFGLIGISLFVTLIFFTFGLWMFRKAEILFVDLG